jgi:hypothetical protein
MRLTYHVAGGVAARLAASLAELVVRGQVRRSLAALKRRVELLARIGPAERRDTRAPRPRAVVPARRRAVEAAGRT